MKASLHKLVANGQYEEAISQYVKAHGGSLKPDHFTFPSLLEACNKLQSIPQLLQIHAHLVKAGFEHEIHTATALVDAYLKLCLFESALKVFEAIPRPTLASFNAVVSGFCRIGCFQESFGAFKSIGIGGLRANSVSIASVLPACRDIKEGLQVHGIGIKTGNESDVFVATALVTMYSNCNEVSSARRVFVLMPEKNVVTYNAIISGYLRNGEFVMALDVFRDMVVSAREWPNLSTLLSVVGACSGLSALMLGKQIHCYCLKCRMNTDVRVATALINMYSNCWSLKSAYRVFEKMDNRNLVTWNSLISGFLSNGKLETAMELLHRLRPEGFKPDMITWNLMISGSLQLGRGTEALKFFNSMQSESLEYPNLNILTSLLQACSQLSNLNHGKEIHCHIIRTRSDIEDEFFHTALMHMYMKCGCSSIAHKIFNITVNKSSDPAVWNAMISGYGRNGEHGLALYLFKTMEAQHVKPNSASFLGALSACSHTGQVEKGWEIFRNMSEKYNIKPKAEHYGCMVDMLSRAGSLIEAWELIQDIPEPSASAFYSLLGACRKYSNAELGERVAERLSELEPVNATALVMLSNIYAGRGRWSDVTRLRKIIIYRKLHKGPGFSWIGT